MEENMKKRLELLKRQLKQREHEKCVAYEKERLISESRFFSFIILPYLTLLPWESL